MSMFTVASARALLNAAGVFYGATDEKVIEVAELFWRYGWGGICYWATQQPTRVGTVSEFKDVQRMIEFVRHEEELRQREPDSSRRAYVDLTYTLGLAEGASAALPEGKL